MSQLSFPEKQYQYSFDHSLVKLLDMTRKPNQRYELNEVANLFSALYVMRTDGGGDLDGDVGLALRITVASYLWGKTKGVYQYDIDLLDKLLCSQIDYPIPEKVFDALPESCTLIHFPKGLFEEGYRYMYVMLVDVRGEKQAMFVLHQGDEERNIEDSDCRYYSVPITNGFDLEASLPVWAKMQSLSADEEAAMKITARRHFQIILPLILYMCTYNPDIERITPEKMVRKDPNRVIHHIVGKRAGILLRQTRKQYDQNQGKGGVGKGKAPHYRRPYFRIQHYGPRPKTGEQDLRVQRTIWIHGVFVNKDRVEQVLPVRSVEYAM